MYHFLIFGTHPLLSLAEARSVLADPPPILIKNMAVFRRQTWAGATLQNRLGGVTKMGDILAEIPAEQLTADYLVKLLADYPRRSGKTVFALSLFGEEAAKKAFKHLPIQLKRAFQERGLKVRWFAGEQGEVSPAAVAKLRLIEEGYDLCIGLHRHQAWIGLSQQVQNADAWSQRDYGRPFRDRRVGMLPPKLARLMVNLAGSGPGSLLDPFCGGGTVLMEAMLVGFRHLIGSDIDPKQIDGSRKNLDWLVHEGWISSAEREGASLIPAAVETLGQHISAPIGRVVTEGYLGKPLRGDEPLSVLKSQQQEVEALWERAFPILARLQPAGGMMVCIWPVFKTQQGVAAVDASKAAKEAGYQLIDPLYGWIDASVDLIYARLDQHVQRRIVVLHKISG